MDLELIILFAILLLIAVFLGSYIRFYVKYEDDLVVYAKFLGFRTRIYPRQIRKEMSAKKMRRLSRKLHKKDRKTKKRSAKSQKSEKAFKSVDSVSLSRNLLRIFIPIIKGLMGRVKVRFNKLLIVVATGDAASTAVSYAAVCNAVGVLIDMFEEKNEWDIRFSSVECRCDYTAESFSSEVDIDIRIRIWQALGLLMKVFINSNKLVQTEV